MNYIPREPLEEVNYSKSSLAVEAVQLVVGLIAVVGVVLIGTAVFIDAIAPRIPVAWEEKIFPDFLTIAISADTQHDKEQLAALESILERLTLHWDDVPYTFGIGVLASEQVNAMALPGGRILVTSALLEAVESENELAFVIGHELGHFHNRDHLRSLGRGLVFGLLLATIGRDGGSGAELIGLTGQLTGRRFSREQEHQADSFGLALVHAEYGHVNGTLQFFDRLPKPKGVLEENLATYLSTHPLHESRVDELMSLAHDRGWKTAGPTSPLP